MKPEVSISLNCASLLGWTTTSDHISTLSDIAKKVGVDSLGFLPFRGMQNYPFRRPLSLPIEYIENAWHPTDFNFFPLSLIQATTNPSFMPWDAMFPSRETCQHIFSKIRKDTSITHITHHFSDKSNTLLEVNPGISMSPAGILNRSILQGLSLVFDPTHLLSSPDLPGWKNQLIFFSPRVSLVDIKSPNPDIISISKELGITSFRIEQRAPFSLQIPISYNEQNLVNYLGDIVYRIRSN